MLRLLQLWCLLFASIKFFGESDDKKLPIVYVYTVVPAVCSHGLPAYIKTSLEQAIFSQPDCDVILASNFADCKHIGESIKGMHNITQIDTTKIASNRTNDFYNASTHIFQKDGFGELWMTSALRFFVMEDIMKHYGYKEMIHVEADNMLYGKLTSILDVFRDGYGGLAATPLNEHVSFITASVMWIKNLESLVRFDDYMLALSNTSGPTWKNYLTYMRFYGCCKLGGIDPDKNGNGIKPFAINEMSMLAYYHKLYPDEFKIFPVVPLYQYNLNRYVCNMSEYGPYGNKVGPPTGHGIWDPNSWGQLIGGTHSRHGRDVGFTDPSHIAGQAIRTTNCIISMLCSNQTIMAYGFSEYKMELRDETSSLSPVVNNGNSSNNTNNSTHHNSDNIHKEHHSAQCYTAPFVRCLGGASGASPWTPLWNLHVHSKHTDKFRSTPCFCTI